LVLLRTIATVFCAIAFSERSADYTNKIARKMFGIDIDEKTQKMIEEAAKSKEIKEEALKYLNPEAIKGMEEFARIVSLQEKGGNFSHLVKVGPFVPREALDEFEKLLRGNNSPSANFQPSSESSSRADTNAKETGSSKGRGE